MVNMKKISLKNYSKRTPLRLTLIGHSLALIGTLFSSFALTWQDKNVAYIGLAFTVLNVIWPNLFTNEETDVRNESK